MNVKISLKGGSTTAAEKAAAAAAEKAAAGATATGAEAVLKEALENNIKSYIDSKDKDNTDKELYNFQIINKATAYDFITKLISESELDKKKLNEIKSNKNELNTDFKVPKKKFGWAASTSNSCKNRN
jgi:hypothetical protein